MKRNFKNILACPLCRYPLTIAKGKIICKKGHTYRLNAGVPVMAKLSDYLETEARAWDKEWKRGVGKSALLAYKNNMRIFKKLGFWEESGEAASLIPTGNNDTVLDLGCGNGVSTNYIRGKIIVGLDLSEPGMVKAKHRFPNKNYVVGEALQLPFKSNVFNTVIAINLVHHIKNSSVVLEEIHRVLKKGGKLFTVDPNLTNPIGFLGRGLYKILGFKKIFPTFPQFALGEEERQFTKQGYYKLFRKSPFKKFVIKPHRIERLLFFSTILIPPLIKIPFYEQFLVSASTIGNRIVAHEPFDHLCYFWKGEAIK